jgi:hypothetical protein
MADFAETAGPFSARALNGYAEIIISKAKKIEKAFLNTRNHPQNKLKYRTGMFVTVFIIYMRASEPLIIIFGFLFVFVFAALGFGTFGFVLPLAVFIFYHTAYFFNKVGGKVYNPVYGSAAWVYAQHFYVSAANGKESGRGDSDAGAGAAAENLLVAFIGQV